MSRGGKADGTHPWALAERHVLTHPRVPHGGSLLVDMPTHFTVASLDMNSYVLLMRHRRMISTPPEMRCAST